MIKTTVQTTLEVCAYSDLEPGEFAVVYETPIVDMEYERSIVFKTQDKVVFIVNTGPCFGEELKNPHFKLCKINIKEVIFCLKQYDTQTKQKGSE